MITLISSLFLIGGMPLHVHKHPLQSSTSTLVLSVPLNYQVVQRKTKSRGFIPVVGRLDLSHGETGLMQARLVFNGHESSWRKLSPTFQGSVFRATLDAPAGGWSRLEVRVLREKAVVAEGAVEHVGVGEVFVVAGQSNSANHGEEKQSTQTGKVATFDGTHWQLSNDPQPGASGGGGSFLPPFGDRIVEQFNVPVGFVSCGIGATSVREWLPRGATFPNPPTIESRVRRLPGGEWESDGQAFDMLIARLKPLGAHGFRAILWHQGESDANQRDTTRTLSGDLYRAYLAQIIRESQRQIGWQAPWFVAQVSYHVPGDEASPDIRAAQEALWKDHIALEGPDTDALKSEWREARGQGVHFSGPGLRKHAQLWAEKVIPWLTRQTK